MVRRSIIHKQHSSQSQHNNSKEDAWYLIMHIVNGKEMTTVLAIFDVEGKGDLRRARSRDKLYWYLLSCLICCMETFLMALRLTSKWQPICPTDLNVALTYKTELGNLLKNCFLLWFRRGVEEHQNQMKTVSYCTLTFACDSSYCAIAKVFIILRLHV